MKATFLLPFTITSVLALVPAAARAHCDTLDGPVVVTARAALEKGKVEPVLAWVAPGDEAEIREAFARARSVRRGGKEARAARGGEPLELFRRLRIDHGALASLLVPTPTAVLVTEIRSLLDPHNEAEEGPGGLYERCDDLLAAGAARLLERMRAYPAVKVAPYSDGPRVLRTAEAALRVSAKQFEGR